jgi:transposase
MRVELSSPDDLATLRARVAAERHVPRRDRGRAVLLAAEGVGGVERTRAQIAAALGRSRQFVDEWVGRYRKLGLAGLDARKAKGNAPALTAAEQAAFRARMLAGPTDADQGKSALRGRDAQRIVAAEFGRPLKLSAVYALMHRVGLSCLRPRPRHRKNDPAAMTAWLERAPFLSMR